MNQLKRVPRYQRHHAISNRFVETTADCSKITVRVVSSFLDLNCKNPFLGGGLLARLPLELLSHVPNLFKVMPVTLVFVSSKVPRR